MKNKVFPVVISLAVLLISACTSSSGALTAQDAWARPAVIGENAAVYFTIENGTSSNDSLLSVSSDIAAAAELHMSMTHDNDVMSMEMQEAVQIPARDQVEFKPGGLHVMLVDLNRDLKVGDTVALTLSFRNAGNVTIDAFVKEP